MLRRLLLTVFGLILTPVVFAQQANPQLSADSLGMVLVASGNGEYDYVLQANKAHISFGFGATIALTGLSGVTNAVLYPPAGGEGRFGNCFRLSYTATSVTLTQIGATLYCQYAGLPTIGILAVFSLARLGTVAYDVQAVEGPFTGLARGPVPSIEPGSRHLHVVRHPLGRCVPYKAHVRRATGRVENYPRKDRSEHGIVKIVQRSCRRLRML
jgi:hypothetical protein